VPAIVREWQNEFLFPYIKWGSERNVKGERSSVAIERAIHLTHGRKEGLSCRSGRAARETLIADTESRGGSSGGQNRKSFPHNNVAEVGKGGRQKTTLAGKGR